VLCCVVLCCAVLCCAVLCCAVLCCAVLCCAVLCCAVLCCAVLCGAMRCKVVQYITLSRHFLTPCPLILLTSCTYMRRLLERKALPQFKKCFETEGILQGLSSRPSCRFEVLKQIVTIELPAPAPAPSSASSSSSASAVSSGATRREVEVEVVLDIAHNEDAMIALVSKVKSLYPNRITRCDYYFSRLECFTSVVS
jgi:hypothetical protein